MIFDNKESDIGTQTVASDANSTDNRPGLRELATWQSPFMSCEGCDIVQSDHAPQAGVAQGIFHGDLIRRRDGHQVELEEELEEEVERRVRRNHSRNKTQVRMHG